MDLICVNDEYFDPYHILGVTNDDSDEFIKQCYKRKVKKYHPDKAPSDKKKDYSRKFKIVVSSYEYIKERRNSYVNKNKQPEYDIPDKKNIKKKDNKKEDNTERIKSMEEYEAFEQVVKNVFDKREFSQEDFNLLFDYMKEQEQNDISPIIDKTNDGFVGYNTTDMQNCGIVKSFNGLLLTMDNFEENDSEDEYDKEYWNDNYADYRRSFSTVYNPEHDVEIEKLKKTNPKKQNITSKSISELKQERSEHVGVRKSISQAENDLYDNVMNSLVEKEQKDMKFILKHANKYYTDDVIKSAIDGKLDATPNLIYALKGHYKSITQ